MKLNAVLYHTISFLGARHLISIFFFCLLSTANMSISPFPEGCCKLIVLKPREDSNTSKAFKTKPRGHILGCFCPTSQPSFSPSLSKINTCLAKLADRLKCLCLKPFLWKTWHLRSNVWWKRVWTKMLVCELAGADRLCWGGKLQRKEGRWGQMVALLRSWDATQRFTKVGLSKPKCLNLPEKKYDAFALVYIVQGLLCICLPMALAQRETNGYLHLPGYLQGHLALKYSSEQHQRS